MFKQLTVALIYFIKILKSFIQLLKYDRKFNFKNSAYLMNLIPSTIPKNSFNKYNIFNWYISNFNYDTSIKEIRHSIKDKTLNIKGMIVIIVNLFLLLTLFLKFLNLFFIFFIQLLFLCFYLFY